MDYALKVNNKLSYHPIIELYNNGSKLSNDNDFLEICQSNNGVNVPNDDLILLTFAEGVNTLNVLETIVL